MDNTQFLVMSALYDNLKSYESFNLADMSSTLTNSRLMTAYGFAGKRALEKSNTNDTSRNSTLMNAKMYAEIFRMLGWIQSYGVSSYPLVFTYIGAHIAELAKQESLAVEKLYQECVLGIVNPNKIINVKYTESSRIFMYILKSIKDLDGLMYKHEMCMGPMSFDDQNDTWEDMVHNIKEYRENIQTYQEFKEEFELFSKNLNMQPTSVDNCTRMPIAMIKQCGFVEDKYHDLYGRKLKCLSLTKLGESTLEKYSTYYDLRLREFNKLPEDQKNAMIRLGLFGMFKRSGFEVDEFRQLLVKDFALVEKVTDGCEVLFSPYQTINRQQIDSILSDLGLKQKEGHGALQPRIIKRKVDESKDMQEIELSDHLTAMNLSQRAQEIIKEVQKLSASNSKDEITSILFKKYQHATQTNFYPDVTEMFNILGLNCHCSRPGDHGARWDAIIIDEKQSIPIEIKSPTEEQNMSVKAVRQALENKIILLSREPYTTSRSAASLALGYMKPNDRAEVATLIKAFSKAFNLNVAVVDFKSLLNMVVSAVCDNKSVSISQLAKLGGLTNADIKKKE